MGRWRMEGWYALARRRPVNGPGISMGTDRVPRRERLGYGNGAALPRGACDRQVERGMGRWRVEGADALARRTSSLAKGRASWTSYCGATGRLNVAMNGGPTNRRAAKARERAWDCDGDGPCPQA
jgi:hypothetical protein